LTFVSAIAVVLNSCGTMYKTQSSGKENASYIVVVKESGRSLYNNVTVVVDGYMYPYGDVVKAKRRAHPVIVEPGRHNVKVVMVNGAVVFDENIFIGLQETRMVVLR